MGFALFESSGTFNPANYGLVVGDTIQVVAVGGVAAAMEATIIPVKCRAIMAALLLSVVSSQHRAAMQ